jgi:hypothetical protein
LLAVRAVDAHEVRTKRMPIQILLDRTYVGLWTFPNAREISMERISGGILVRFPSVLRLSYSSQPTDPQAHVSNLRARVVGGGVELGIASQDRIYLGTNPGGDTIVPMEMRVPASVLEQYEQARNGAEVRFCFDATGDICGLMHGNGRPPIQTAVTQFNGQTQEVTYPLDAWVGALNRVGFGLHVLAEVPLRPAPPAPWDEVWKALADARTSFDQGGNTGWVNCVRSVRHALELWQGIEAEDHGPGWHAPNRNDREQRTAAQRRDNVRWDLLQYAHRAPHGHADEWNRDEAMLLMTTLAALLRVRAP